MAWWLWLLVGLALLGVEMLTPGGFFTIFFGVAAIVVGVLSRFGLAGPPWMQWLLFSVAVDRLSPPVPETAPRNGCKRREVKRPDVDTLDRRDRRGPGSRFPRAASERPSSGERRGRLAAWTMRRFPRACAAASSAWTG